MSNLNGILLMENHNDALSVWKEKGIKDRTLVHVDAHLDAVTIPQKDPLEILEAKSISEFNRIFEVKQNWNLTNKDFYNLVNIGNYIYAAIRDGLIREFWWVVPDIDFNKTRKWFQKYLKSLAKKDKFYAKEVLYSNNIVKGKLFNQTLNICNIDALPRFEEEVLLDIDCDYFVYKSARQRLFSDILDKKKPWIEPKEFVNILKKKDIKMDLITIAHSVEGGFTPIEYKYFGYELRDFCQELLSDNHIPSQEKENAGVLFNRSKAEWEKGELNQAVDLYRKALKLDPTFRSYFNNRGFLYEKYNLLNKAFSEYDKILSLDPECPYNNVNMGRLLIKKGKLDGALPYLKRAIKTNVVDYRAYSLLGDIYFRKKEFEEALALYKHSLEMEPEDVSALINSGIIYWKMKHFEKAQKNLKKATKLNPYQIKARILLIRLYMRKNLAYKTKKEIVNCAKILPTIVKMNIYSGLSRIIINLQKGV